MTQIKSKATMRAVLADPAHAGSLPIVDVPLPQVNANQALVRVHAVSLNAGDTRSALAAERVYVPGWDFAGIVEEPARDGSSPPKGARVFGFVLSGAWGQYVAVNSGLLAMLPDEVSFAQAAALPVAALTPLRAQRLAGDVKDQDVLITGTAGGVGRYACQLAARAGARVHAISRRPETGELLREDGVELTALYPSMEKAVADREYDYILETVGGASLGLALGALRRGGACVTCGNSTGEPSTFETRDFYMKCDTRLHGLYLASAVLDGDAAPDLEDVAQMVADGTLRAPIGDQRPWTEIENAARDLKGQRIDGKIILMVD